MQLRTVLLTAAFAATIPAVNWMIGNVGTECIPDGPCLIPVGFGLHAPSGVLMVGAALVLRDALQEAGGIRAAVVAMAIGAVLSFFLAPAAIVVASVSAFLLSEVVDLAVYTPLRRRGLAVAVLASGLVGAIVDSAVFLWLAFGSLDFIAGQIIGKLWMSLAASAVILILRNARQSGAKP